MILSFTPSHRPPVWSLSLSRSWVDGGVEFGDACGHKLRVTEQRVSERRGTTEETHRGPFSLQNLTIEDQNIANCSL